MADANGANKPTNVTVVATIVATILAGAASLVGVDQVGSNIRSDVVDRLRQQDKDLEDALNDQDKRLIRFEERISNLPPPDLLLRVSRLEQQVDGLATLLERATADRYHAATAKAELRNVQLQIDQIKTQLREIEKPRIPPDYYPQGLE